LRKCQKSQNCLELKITCRVHAEPRRCSGWHAHIVRGDEAKPPVKLSKTGGFAIRSRALRTSGMSAGIAANIAKLPELLGRK
jgi:hypothetical protein